MKICTPPTQCSDRLLSEKSIATETVRLKLDFSTELFFGSDLSEKIVSFCRPLSLEIVLFADSSLLDLYAKDLKQRLNALLLPIPSGEKAKTSDIIEKLSCELFEKQIGRDALFIALGGGATCDAIGFLASIYLRGVSLVFLPTTLLAMVDAAIGGKTAIDTPFGKNLIGTFYPPKAVFIDERFLKTLPEIERLNGLAEIFKLGLVSNRSLCYEKDPFLIKKAIQGKMAIVSQDFLDQSIRRILNFGHTIAHALETISNYEMPHGLAVALGCVVESHLSWQLKMLSESDWREILNLYQIFPLRLPKNYQRDAFLQALILDKKRTQKAARFVLLEKIGKASPFDGEYCREVSGDELLMSLEWMEKTYG